MPDRLELFFKHLTVAVLYASLSSTAAAAAGGSPTVQIQSRWIGDRFLIVKEATAQTGSVNGDYGLWILEKQGAEYRIRNVGSGEFLGLPPDSDEVALDKSSASSDRQLWRIEPSDDGVAISNKATGKFLNIQNLNQPVNSGMAKMPTRKSWTSGLWSLVHVSGPPLQKFQKAGEVLVTSPTFGSTIKGDTTLEIQAPGWKEVTVKSWLGGGEFGEDSTVAKVTLDAEGKGTAKFPADHYPHGPITIRVMAEEGKKKRNYYLMVYNDGGIPWNEGAPKDIPAPAKGMKLAYLDEFDKKELSISKDGIGTTYMSHKPGGGDFSGIPFGDHENKEKTPFSVRDTFLRIRADQSKNTTGLLSSVNVNGEGFTAKAPCYFECRFLAHTAPGTWPAFWVMTNYMIKEKDLKPLRRTSDELDVIEAYGGEGAKTPNAPGYMIHAHYWNQAPGGGKDYSQDRFAGPIHMTKLRGGKASSWYETFHTYGVLISKEDTVYYCDGMEVARHKTAKLSKSEPIFFYVNHAVGGASGWKIDLSQYGGISDMYVDYVRVFQGE